MRLKKLEIQGFKSFVDYTQLVFEPGISAIVGPNGCGKSNISDSIRWVLGEQSAKALRGSAMMDVIFNGTENRKPSGMAEVSLTISNEDRQLPTDFSEVTVTRRAFRSGESEYLLNKTPCRLKDIYALFADTGVGTDGYSLLEQGKMDLIISSKPADRRSVFEEAAGITKYKGQRDEALRKLESTDQNLLRVNDILLEVRRQINSLERQAKKAEKYKVLKTQLDQLQSKLLLGEYRELSEKQKGLLQALEDVKMEIDGLEAQMKEKEAQLSQLHLQLAEDEEALGKAAAAVHAIESDLAQIDRKVEVNRAQIVHLADREERALREAEALKEKAQQSASALAEVEKESQELGHQLEALKAELEGFEKQGAEKASRRNELSAQAQQLQQEMLELINQRTQVRGEADSLRGRLVVVEQNTQALRQQLMEVQEALHQTSLELETAAQQAGGKQEEIKSLEGNLGGRYRQRQDLEEAVRAAEESLSASQVALSSLQSRLAVLSELSRVLSGYEAGPKALLLAKQEGDARLAGFSSLAHHVRTKAEYELAVEIGLGHRLQTLLCGSAEEVKAALQWLKEKNQGRASLLALPLASQGDFWFSQEILSQPGVVGVLSNLMEIDDPNLTTVLRWLGGTCLLVDRLDTALNLLPQVPHWASLVTQQGEIVTAQGLITGGSVETPERGLLGREREISELQTQIQELTQQIEQRKVDRDRLKGELNQVAQEISATSATLQEVQIAAAELEKERSSKRAAHERLSQELGAKRKAIEESDALAAQQQAKISELEGKLAELQNRETERKDHLNHLLDGVDALRAEESALQTQSSEKRVEQASKNERLGALQAAKLRLGAEQASYQEQVLARQEESKQSAQERQALAQENLGLEERLKELFGRKDEAEKEVKRLGEIKHSHQKNLQQAESGIRELRQSLHQASDKRHQQEMAVQELKISQDRLSETLVQEYHVNLEESSQTTLEMEPGVDPKQRVAELKEKVAELGAVNPAAAEEYHELEQRHALLSTQVEDLKNAKADLHKVITKINQTSRERFLSTFETVHQNFQETFKQLFRGGEAKLILQDEQGDLLESGIEIVARPPGKRQQSISLLSGGEKALTAIALLFALFKLKPSPFCLLDEIDAPLDDANISRFSSLLVDYAQRSQFIVITHSKLTMEKADVMYGITMEESGVSRVISAKFKDEKAVAVEA